MSDSAGTPPGAGRNGRRRDKRAGLLIIGAAFCAAIAISWTAKRAAQPEVAEAPEPPTQEGIDGFPNAVTVTDNLERAEELTRRRELRGVIAEGVKSDGTIDVTRAGSRLEYVFGSKRGEGPQPPRPPGTVLRRDFCGQQSVMITADGVFARTDEPRHACVRRARSLPTPRCGAQEVWAYAIKKGIPGDRPARMEYFSAKGGPAWRFNIPNSHHRFVLYGDCQRELRGKEAFGTIP